MRARGRAGKPDRRRKGAIRAAAWASGIALAGLSIGVGAQQTGQGDHPEPGLTEHLTLTHPGQLDAAAAEAVYLDLVDEMAARYRISGDPVAEAYLDWPRFNTAPYLSALHGNRYVNNYGNARADAYGRFEDVGTLPEGAVVVKDSFAVTDRGDVFTGPLFVMEKMPPGFNPAGRDWRYTMIMPDGSLFGTTNGDGSARVEFCVTCHRAAGDDRDHLFFLPQEYRRRFLGAPAGP